jgi:exodeoxyribonuclease V beta subunit
LLDWLGEALRTPLPGVGITLEAVAEPLPEMEFWLPSDGLYAEQIDALCRSHLLHGQSRPALAQRQLRGMLMGFADLLFVHDGRYWVLDYKSNHLGDQPGDYGPGQLEAAMTAHRYDVQAALYLLALHRLLRARLGAAYEPSRQLGGAVFYFLRGLRGPADGCCVLPASPALVDGLDRLMGAAVT